MIFKFSLLFVYLFHLTLSHADYDTAIEACEDDGSLNIENLGIRILEILAYGDLDIGLPAADDLQLNDVKLINGTAIWIAWDVEGYGSDMCIITSLRRCVNSLNIYLELDCPTDIQSRYFAYGQLLGIPLWGNGLYELYSDDIKYKILMDIEEIVYDDHIKFWNITDYSYNYNPIEPVYYNLTGLYDGDEDRIQTFLDAANMNSEFLAKSLDFPLFRDIVVGIVTHICELFKYNSVDDLGALEDNS